MVEVTTNFLAAGGNRHPNAADWDPHGSGLLAYGAGNNIALWDPLDPTYRGSFAALSGHTKTVNAVKFFPSSDPEETIILSAAADNTVRIWASDASSPTNFRQKQVLTAHTASVNCIAVLPGTDIFASGAADATVRIWKLQRGDDGSLNAELLQTIELKGNPKTSYFPLTVALAQLSPSTVVLASAGTKNHIQIYVQQDATSPTFSLAATLKGHEDWIRSLSFAREDPTADTPFSSDLLLASASQDKYVRLWRIHAGTELPAASKATAADSNPAMGGAVLGRSLHNKAHRIADAEAQPYSVTFEALLVGHEDWIYSAQWRQHQGKGKEGSQTLQLLTASADNSVAVWEADPLSGVWISVARLGEISAQKGATTATGSAGGFWVGLWAPDGRAVVSLGRTGGWRLWTHGRTTGGDEATKAEEDGAQEDDGDRWTQRVAVTGHVRAVRDVAWARDGSYLLSTSADQTTRLFAQWTENRRLPASSSSSSSSSSWHEFSRPQIHGYDLNTLAPLGPLRFVSGADEKLLRVFDQPVAVARLLERLCGIAAPTANQTTSSDSATAAVTLPDAANIPVLGLSNKAIDTKPEDNNNAEGEETAAGPNPSSAIALLAHPPLEDHLSRHLLWPEAEKLYGHGYEISAAAASASARAVATACRATSIDHAVLRVYETRAWRQTSFAPGAATEKAGQRERVPSMRLHALTVTALAFAPDDRGDRYLLSVGRDRVFGVWQREGEDEGEEGSSSYRLVHAQDKAHSRMLLGVSWAPMAAGSSATPMPRFFATAGRDSKVKLWRLSPALSEEGEGAGKPEVTNVATLAADVPVTAVAFHPSLIPDGENGEGKAVLAFGTEKGGVSVSVFAADFSDAAAAAAAATSTTTPLAGEVVPSDVVNALAWRPVGTGKEKKYGEDGVLELAVGSEDGSVRIYGVRL